MDCRLNAVRVLGLVESLPASPIAGQTHPCPQQDKEGIQMVIGMSFTSPAAAASRNVVLLLTLLRSRDVETLTSDGWLLLDELANGLSTVILEADL